MGLHGAPGHVELCGNLGVVTTLQKQLDDLLFARTEPNGLVLHFIPPCLWISVRPLARPYFAIPRCIRVAIVRRNSAFSLANAFSTATCGLAAIQILLWQSLQSMPCARCREHCAKQRTNGDVLWN